MNRRFATIRAVTADAWMSVTERPGRSATQAVAIAIAVGCGVATIGLAATGAGAIDGQRNLLTATSMVVVPLRNGEVSRPMTADDVDRIRKLPGVAAAELVTTVSRPVAVRTGRFTTDAQPIKVTVVEEPALRMFGARPEDRSLPSPPMLAPGTAVLGASAADALGIGTATLGRPAELVVDGRLVPAVAIVGSFARRPDLARNVLIVRGRSAVGEPVIDGATESSAEQSIELTIAPGAAGPLSREIPLAISADAPGDVVVNSVPELAALGEALSKTTRSVMLTLGLVAGGLAAAAIASSTNAQVVRRRPEFALRRVFGASGRRIVALVAAETAVVCSAGGVVGAWSGTVVVAVVAFAKRWVPVMSPLVPIAGVGVGVVIGLAAAAWPATRALSIEPRAALAAD